MHTILIFSSNGQQQFVSSLVLHLSISSSFAEGRGEIESGIIVFCGTCNNNLTCICGIIMTGGRARGRVTLCHVLSPLSPSAACYVLQCSNSLSNAALSVALPSREGEERDNTAASSTLSNANRLLQWHHKHRIDIGISIGTCIIIMIIASCNSKS